MGQIQRVAHLVLLKFILGAAGGVPNAQALSLGVCWNKVAQEAPCRDSAVSALVAPLCASAG